MKMKHILNYIRESYSVMISVSNFFTKLTEILSYTFHRNNINNFQECKFSSYIVQYNTISDLQWKHIGVEEAAARFGKRKMVSKVYFKHLFIKTSIYW